MAYFAAIPKSDLAKSEVIVAGIFFRNVFGDSAGARSLPVFVSLSNLGNVLAVSFSQARVNQGIHLYSQPKGTAYRCVIPELAKEGLLPWSSFWASNKPFNAPAASVCWNSSRLFLFGDLTRLTCLKVIPTLAHHDYHTPRPTSWASV